jgi:hypothetical protein
MGLEHAQATIDVAKTLTDLGLGDYRVSIRINNWCWICTGPEIPTDSMFDIERQIQDALPGYQARINTIGQHSSIRVWRSQ